MTSVLIRRAAVALLSAIGLIVGIDQTLVAVHRHDRHERTVVGERTVWAARLAWWSGTPPHRAGLRTATGRPPPPPGWRAAEKPWQAFVTARQRLRADIPAWEAATRRLDQPGLVAAPWVTALAAARQQQPAPDTSPDLLAAAVMGAQGTTWDHAWTVWAASATRIAASPAVGDLPPAARTAIATWAAATRAVAQDVTQVAASAATVRVVTAARPAWEAFTIRQMSQPSPAPKWPWTAWAVAAAAIALALALAVLEGIRSVAEQRRNAEDEVTRTAQEHHGEQTQQVVDILLAGVRRLTETHGQGRWIAPVDAPAQEAWSTLNGLADARARIGRFVRDTPALLDRALHPVRVSLASWADAMPAGTGTAARRAAAQEASALSGDTNDLARQAAAIEETVRAQASATQGQQWRQDGLRDTIQATARSVKRVGEDAILLARAAPALRDAVTRLQVLVLNIAVEGAATENGEPVMLLAREMQGWAETLLGTVDEIDERLLTLQRTTQESGRAIEAGVTSVIEGFAGGEHAAAAAAGLEIACGELHHRAQQVHERMLAHAAGCDTPPDQDHATAARAMLDDLRAAMQAIEHHVQNALSGDTSA